MSPRILGPMSRTLAIARYVTPLREGGSMPAVVDGDDGAAYVLKFRGAGQGVRALVAEWIAGEVARAIGLPVPALALATLDAELARTEGDPEIQHLVRASAGTNLVMAYLPGAANFDPAAWRPDAAFASRLVWFDALVCNVDRTARNPNLMEWRQQVWLIDHGASMYFHHGWDLGTASAATPFARVKDHVLLRWADAIEAADAELAPRLSRDVLAAIVGALPDDWLTEGDRDPAVVRAAYVAWLEARLAHRAVFVAEAVRARG